MKKLLINCSFSHFPSGTWSKMVNFALIITVDECEIDLRPLIVKGLTELNFHVNQLDSFTAQPF